MYVSHTWVSADKGRYGSTMLKVYMISHEAGLTVECSTAQQPAVLLSPR